MWFKKKEEINEGLPELPELPPLPELSETSKSGKKEEINEGLPELPEPPVLEENFPLPPLPSPEPVKRIDQQAFKSEISKEKIKPYTREIPSGHFRIESSDRVRESADSRRKEEAVREMRANQRVHPVMPSFAPKFQPSSEKSEPVFVRLDKFQNAVKNFSEIKRQLVEIESYLEEIKKIRLNEDQELGEWEREILNIKEKLESIDRGVFSKLD